MIDECIEYLSVDPTKEFFKPDELYHCLVYVHNLLQKNNIKHFLLYGTLLGCIREKNIIEYDYDFDMGIMYEDVEKILSLKQEDNDFQFKKMYLDYSSKSSNFKRTEEHWRVSLGVYFKDKKAGDLYVYHSCKDAYTRRYDPNLKLLFWPKSTFPTVLIECLSSGFIRDVEFPIPNHPVVLLEYFYGPMWTIPIKAQSQDGNPYEDYDYYADYKYSTLGGLIERTKEEFSKDKIEINLNKPNLTYDDIEFVFPDDQLDWIEENEGVVLSKCRKKNKKKKKKEKKESKEEESDK